MTGRNGPENTTYAPVLVIAGPQDRGFGLLIGDLPRDRVHSRLPGQSLTEVDLLKSLPRERQSRAQGCRIKKIQRQDNLLQGFLAELPSMSQIRRGL